MKKLTLLTILMLSYLQVTFGQSREEIANNFTTESFEFNDNTLPYRLFTPKNSQNIKRPLILALHGSGEVFRETEDIFFSSYATGWAADIVQNRYPCYVLAPHSKLVFWNNETTREGVALLISSFIEQELINPNRIYVTGYSAGGYGTWEFGADFPIQFAAMVPLSGFWNENSTIATLSELPDKLEDISIWNFHHVRDGDVLVGSSDEIIQVLEDGGLPFQKNADDLTEVSNDQKRIYTKYTQESLPCTKPRADCHYIVDHVVTLPALHDWLFSQRLKENDLYTIKITKVDESSTASISWITKTEIETDSIEISYRNTGSTSWQPLTKQPANINNYSLISFIDEISSPVDLRISILDENQTVYGMDSILNLPFGTQSSVLNIKNKDLALSIYPNPAQEILHIKTLSNPYYKLVTMSGQAIMKGQLTDGTIDVSHIRPGIYLLLLKSDDAFKSVRIVIE